MKYTAMVKGKELELNFEPTYDPMDFIRNNDELDLFRIENWKLEIDMKNVLEIMVQCYKDLLIKNYL